jgi:hypothetical protein
MVLLEWLWLVSPFVLIGHPRTPQPPTPASSHPDRLSTAELTGSDATCDAVAERPPTRDSL